MIGIFESEDGLELTCSFEDVFDVSNLKIGMLWVWESHRLMRWKDGKELEEIRFETGSLEGGMARTVLGTRDCLEILEEEGKFDSWFAWIWWICGKCEVGTIRVFEGVELGFREGLGIVFISAEHLLELHIVGCKEIIELAGFLLLLWFNEELSPKIFNPLFVFWLLEII